MDQKHLWVDLFGRVDVGMPTVPVLQPCTFNFRGASFQLGGPRRDLLRLELHEDSFATNLDSRKPARIAVLQRRPHWLKAVSLRIGRTHSSETAQSTHL